MAEKKSKNERILSLYSQLCAGRIVNKAEMAVRFGVDERSIQRDLDDVRAFLADEKAENGSVSRDIIYDRDKRGYVLVEKDDNRMSNTQIFAVSEILLASRAFTKNELEEVLNKLINGCAPRQNKQFIEELISNERYHYVELANRKKITEILWQLGEEIKNQNLLRLTYQKQAAVNELVVRTVQPLAIIFSDYYFYLHAWVVEETADGKLERKYSYPTIFRMDRIKNYERLDKKFRMVYTDRFEDGEFRKRCQFMFAGELMKVQFKYTGFSTDFIMDRFPTARIIRTEGKEHIIEAEAYGQGMVKWLLSQGTEVEVLKPGKLRDKVRNTVLGMMERYE